MIQFYHINYLFSVLTFPPLPAQIISLFLFFILRLSYLCSHFSLTWSSDYLLLVLTFNLPLPPIFILHSPCSYPPFFIFGLSFLFPWFQPSSSSYWEVTTEYDFNTLLSLPTDDSCKIWLPKNENGAQKSACFYFSAHFFENQNILDTTLVS